MHTLHRLADRVAALPAAALEQAGTQVAELAGNEARRVTGDGRLSGMGRRGPRLRAVPKTVSRGTRAAVQVRGVPAGPWTILQSGARPHVIRAATTALYGPGMRHPVRAAIRHPGTRGKRTWDRVVTAAGRLVPDVIADELEAVCRAP